MKYPVQNVFIKFYIVPQKKSTFISLLVGNVDCEVPSKESVRICGIWAPFSYLGYWKLFWCSDIPFERNPATRSSSAEILPFPVDFWWNSSGQYLVDSKTEGTAQECELEGLLSVISFSLLGTCPIYNWYSNRWSNSPVFQCSAPLWCDLTLP